MSGATLPPQAGGARPAGLLYLMRLPSDPALVARTEQADGAYQLPVLRAADLGALAAVVATGGQAVPAGFLALRRPRLVILADHRPGAAGPGGWPQAGRLLRWAKGAVFHAAAARPAEYEMIAEATIRCGRLLLVECEFRHLDAWCALAARELPRLKLLKIVPREGQHPVQGAADARRPSGGAP